jgi:small subunit ribosomal protein S16
LEQLGTYDPMIPETDARTMLNVERVKYWLSVGALPTEKVQILLTKYGPDGTHLEKQKEAIDRLAQTRRRPTPPARPVQAAAAEAPAAPADDAAAE